MGKKLVIIDMQNDFCTGALANENAVKIIPYIKERLLDAIENEYEIIFTRDTHNSNYLHTLEGKHLPVPHCIENTKGWEIVDELKEVVDKNKDASITFINKEHFGYPHWDKILEYGDEVNICGVVSSICVAANVSIIKTLEGVEVNVLSKGCADMTQESHEAALTVMAAQQANIL